MSPLCISPPGQLQGPGPLNARHWQHPPIPNPHPLEGRGVRFQQGKTELKHSPRGLVSKTALPETGGKKPSHSLPVRDRPSCSSGVRKHPTEQSPTRPQGLPSAFPPAPAPAPPLLWGQQPARSSVHCPHFVPSRLCVATWNVLPSFLPLANSCSPVGIHLGHHLLQEAFPERHMAWLSPLYSLRLPSTPQSPHSTHDLESNRFPVCLPQWVSPHAA